MLDRPTQASNHLRGTQPSEVVTYEKHEYCIFSIPLWLKDIGYKNKVLDNARAARRKEKIEARRLSTLAAEQALESVAANEGCDSLTMDTGMVSLRTHRLQDTQESYSKTGAKIEEEVQRQFTIAEHIRRRRKGRLANLHPLKVREVMQMKKSRGKFSLKGRFGKFLQPD